MCKQNRNTEVEKIYMPKGGVVIVEYDKKGARPLIKSYCGG